MHTILPARFSRRLALTVALVCSTFAATPTVAPAAPSSTASNCQFSTPSGAPSPINHVIHIQFDNVHLRRDNPNVPSDLEQMPHLLNFIERNGTILANEHTPLIAHTANDLLTGLTGVYGDAHGIPVSNSFEIYSNSPVGSYNTSAFSYWTDKVKQDPANLSRQMPFQMLDAPQHNLQAPWVPFVNAGCNFGAVSTVNMVLENGASDVVQVFGAGSPEASESSSAATNDFVGIAVHCADVNCSTVGSGVPGSGSNAKPELGGQGFGALYGHKYVATQVSPITQTDGTAITGFGGFDPSPQYTLGYVLSLLKANVPVVYGYIADAHDSRNSCEPTTAQHPMVSDVGKNGIPCGSYAPGEPGYVQQLKIWDAGFATFFDKLDQMGINQSNTVFVFHSDENDHYAGSAPLNPGCDGVQTACKYDRTRLGEVTTDLPLLLQQQGLYDFGGSFGRPGFTNKSVPYGIDFDTAPGFWLKGHPANGSPPVRTLERALAKVTDFNPYERRSEPLFRFLIDQPGLAALHMISADPNRTPGVVGFGAEDNFIQLASLINASNTPPSSACNVYPAPDDATCLSNGFIWLHGDYAEDVNHTWAGLVGPGVAHRGVDSQTWADHTDLRPTLMALVCLKDSYSYQGRALIEDMTNSALAPSLADNREELTELGRVYKQVNAPVAQFGRAAIALSTHAIKSDDATYASLEGLLSSFVSDRDALAAQMQARLGVLPGCGAGGDLEGHRGRGLGGLMQRGQALLDRLQSVVRRAGDDEGRDR